MKFRGSSIVGSALINTAAGLLSLTAGFGSSVIVARLLGVEGAGIFAYALWVMTLATLVSDRGMPQAALRFISGDVDDGDSRSKLFTALTKRFVLASSMMAIALLGYALWLYSRHESPSAMVWMATTVLFLSYAYSTMATGAAHGLGQFRSAADKTAIGCIIQPFAVLFGALVMGPAGAILGCAARHLPQAFALRKYVVASPSMATPISPAVAEYARHNWLTGSISAILNSRIELAIIGLFFSFVEVGYYAVGVTMAGLVIQLSMFLLANLVPYFGSLHDREDVANLALAYERSLRWLGIALAPICFGGAAIMPVLIPSIFGQEFSPAIHVAEVLIAFSFATALTTVASRMMLARQRSGDVLKFSIAWGAVSVILMLIVIPFFGGLGGAWVKAAVNVATLVSLLWYCQSRLSAPFVALDIFKIIGAAVLSALAAQFCIAWIPGLAGMGLGIAAGGVVYLTSILLLSVIPGEEKAVLSNWISNYLRTRFKRRAWG